MLYVRLMVTEPPCEALEWPPGIAKATGFPVEGGWEPSWGWRLSMDLPALSQASHLFLGRGKGILVSFPPCSWCFLALI